MDGSSITPKYSLCVDLFGNTGTQNNEKISIAMNKINSVSISRSYSQISLNVKFLQTFWPGDKSYWCHFLFAQQRFSFTWCSWWVVIACLLAMSDMFKHTSLLKARAPVVLCKIVATIVPMTYCKCQSLINNISCSSCIVRKIARHECVLNVCNHLVHAFTNQVQLWILTSGMYVLKLKIWSNHGILCLWICRLYHGHIM